MTPILKWLIIQVTVKDTLKKMQKLIREHEGPWAVTVRLSRPVPQVFLVMLCHIAVYQGKNTNPNT